MTQELSDARLLQLWDTHVGDVTDKAPLIDADKLRFARAAILAHAAEVGRHYAELTARAQAMGFGNILSALSTMERINTWEPDEFNGNTFHLIVCINSLLKLDEAGALAPHGIGGHARTLLAAAARRLVAANARGKNDMGAAMVQLRAIWNEQNLVGADAKTRAWATRMASALAAVQAAIDGGA